MFSSCVYYSETESDDDCEAADALNDCDDGDDCDNDECECSCVQRRRSRRGPSDQLGAVRPREEQAAAAVREQSSSSSSSRSSEAAAAAPASPVPPAAPAAPPVQCWPPDRVTSIVSGEACDNAKVSLG